MRRTWLRGLVDVTKRYLIATAAHNLGLVLRTLLGVGTSRTLQGSSEGEQSGEGTAAESLLGVLTQLWGMLTECAHLRRGAPHPFAPPRVIARCALAQSG